MLNRSKISNLKPSFDKAQHRQISKSPRQMKLTWFTERFWTAGFIGLTLLERLVFDLGPNVELITLTTFLAAYYIGKRHALAVPLVSLAISDIFLGNTSIMLFTWTAYLVIAIVAGVLSLFKKTGWQKVVFATGGGVVGSLWFYFWTNFGVWLLDSWGMYADNFTGLVQSYINGLPFLRSHLVSNFIILSIGFGLIETTKYILHFFDSRKFYLSVYPLKLRNSVHPLR